jgi:hypothetical protein
MRERLLLEAARSDSEDTPLLAADHKTGPVIKDDLGEMA